MSSLERDIERAAKVLTNRDPDLEDRGCDGCFRQLKKGKKKIVIYFSKDESFPIENAYYSYFCSEKCLKKHLIGRYRIRQKG